jgi:LysR family glycine cleavage system transcriptional activator
MTIKLPPLTALRAFEAAARLESFSKAADEMFVTHSAVSHQIKSLEEYLGVPLFSRQGRRRVTLTSEGIYLAERVRSALIQVAEAAAAISRQRRTNRLNVSVLPSFAARWLMPRMGRFMELNPGLEVNVQTSSDLTDFARDETDLAIRWGRGNWPHLHSEHFLDDEYFVVCSPKFNRGRLPKKPQDLAKYPLMRADPGMWKRWFQTAGVDLPEPTVGIEFNDAALMLQGALDGSAIALTRSSIAAWDLERGNLVRLFDAALPSDRGYYLVWPEPPKPSPVMLKFRAWLLEEKERSV